jgi:hypothetical protein
MARSMTSQLILELLDRVTGPARKAAGSMRGLNRTVKETTGGQVSMADRIAAAQTRTQVSLDRARLGMIDTIGSYYLLKNAIAAPIQAAANFETQLEDIGQKAGIPQEALGALGERIKAVARDGRREHGVNANADDGWTGDLQGRPIQLV